MGLSLRAQGGGFHPATMSASRGYFHAKQKGNEIKRTSWLSSSPTTNCINRATWNLNDSPGLTQSTHLDAEDDNRTGFQVSVTVNNNPFQDYSHLDDYTPPTMRTYGLYCYCPWTVPFNDHTRICQLSWIIRECPGYGTDLPLFCMGHQISPIKWTFELFCALVWNLTHFFSQNLNFFIHNMVSGTFLHIFSLWQGSVCGWGVVGLLTFRGRGVVQNRETPGWRSLAVDISACTVMEWALTCLFDLFSGLIWPL